MATATVHSTRPASKKSHENRAETQPASTLEIHPPTGADYFEIIARATHDAVRDWNVITGALTWPRGSQNLLGLEDGPGSREIAAWWKQLHPEDLPQIQDSLQQAFAGTADRWSGEYRIRAIDGEYRHILERALIFRNESGQVIRVAGPLMDVTLRRKMQNQACQAQRMEAFGQLAGGVAHDFNNFLTTILGYSDLLLTETGVRGQIASQIKEIREAAGRASSLTNQLLAFSRRQALEPTVLEVNSFIGNLERSLLRLLGDHIAITCHLHQLKEGAHLRADSGQLTQIILNLAVNARDAMPQGGDLVITTNTVALTPETLPPGAGAELIPGDYVSISLTDTGRGMSEEVQARLFEPFFTTKAEKQNSGLGLATSYGIVRQSGGHIYAESEVGGGTTFHILLPRVAPPPPAGYRKASDRKLPTGTETVLVLEDEVGVRHLSVRVLRKLGYHVIEAARGEDAKRYFSEAKNKPIDLLLTDLVMPEISGRDFADWLNQASPQTRVIFISGYLEESLHPRERRALGNNFLAKPFTAEALASKVRQVLDE